MKNLHKAKLIVGLPGSGKSTLGRQFFEKGRWDHLVDDPKDLNEYKNYIGKDFILVDPHLCLDHVRLEIESVLKSNNYEVSFVFFENNPEQCLINAHNRKTIEGIDRACISYIRFLTKHYNPVGFIPCFKAD